jgi:hypothetical protein
MAKADLNEAHMKNEQVPIGTGVMVNTTQMLDGAAKDSPVFDETNETVQYKTPAIPKDNLGGRNDPNG